MLQFINLNQQTPPKRKTGARKEDFKEFYGNFPDLNGFKNQIEKDTTCQGLYDHLHLGVLFLETNDYEKAINEFKKQSKINEIAETYYYQALAFKKIKNQEKYSRDIKKAQELYLSKKYMIDIYTHHIDKIYLQDIQNEIEKNQD